MDDLIGLVASVVGAVALLGIAYMVSIAVWYVIEDVIKRR